MKGSEAVKKLVRLAIFMVAGVMTVYGISRGETAVVLNKAINICLECIGIG